LTAGTNAVTLNDTVDVGFISDYTTSPVTPGVVALSGITVAKQGSGQLFLDNTGATGNNFSGSTLDIVAAGWWPWAAVPAVRRTRWAPVAS